MCSMRSVSWIVSSAYSMQYFSNLVPLVAPFTEFDTSESFVRDNKIIFLQTKNYLKKLYIDLYRGSQIFIFIHIKIFVKINIFK